MWIKATYIKFLIVLAKIRRKTVTNNNCKNLKNCSCIFAFIYTPKVIDKLFNRHFYTKYIKLENI